MSPNCFDVPSVPRENSNNCHVCLGSLVSIGGSWGNEMPAVDDGECVQEMPFITKDEEEEKEEKNGNHQQQAKRGSQSR